MDTINKYIGREPSGRNFNEIVLDYNGKFGQLTAGNILRTAFKFLLMGVVYLQIRDDGMIAFLVDESDSVNGYSLEYQLESKIEPSFAFTIMTTFLRENNFRSAPQPDDQQRGHHVCRPPALHGEARDVRV